MTDEDERQEYEDVQRWAQGKPADIVRVRIDELLKTNGYAREQLVPSLYGDGHQQGRGDQPILTNSTGYGYVGSENFEHDDTGDQMNLSGVEDTMLNAMAESEGWMPGYDFDPAE